MTLGEALAALIREQGMMAIGGLRQAQQRLQEPVHMSGGQEILTARDERHLLQRVVHRHREVIARGRVLAREDHIAEQARIHRDRAMRPIGEGERPGPQRGLCRVKSQRIGAPRGNPRRAQPGIEAPAGSGVAPMLQAVRRLPCGGDLGAAAEAGIEHPHLLQAPQRRRVIGEVLGLAAHRLRPAQPEPAEVLQDAGLELGPAARPVDVLDA
jgi:hypothetical protein